MPFDEMAREIVARVKHVILFGEMAPLVEQAVRATAQTPERPPLTRCHTLEEAVAVAADVAEAGDLVLLSPGGYQLRRLQRLRGPGRALQGTGPTAALTTGRVFQQQVTTGGHRVRSCTPTREEGKQ
ncbi:MAG: hypothetical protein Q9O62_00420 [Ardenticatenia bacterium]|nr:hypothetical protein [Ardenticatenia bacterium]